MLSTNEKPEFWPNQTFNWQIDNSPPLYREYKNSGGPLLVPWKITQYWLIYRVKCSQPMRSHYFGQTKPSISQSQPTFVEAVKNSGGILSKNSIFPEIKGRMLLTTWKLTFWPNQTSNGRIQGYNYVGNEKLGWVNILFHVKNSILPEL